MNLNRFVGKTVVITGSGSGIGKATAIRFAQEGANIVNIDMDKNNAEKTEGAIKKLGRKVLTIIGDISKKENIKNFVAKSIERFTQVDILINNAGIGANSISSLIALAVEKWDKIMNVNLRGTFLMCKYFLKVMVKNKRSEDSPIKGKIINVASMRGKIPKAKMAAYSASKAGVIALTKSLALELGPRRITVNAVCPGTIFTGIWGVDKKPEDIEGFGGQVPLKYKKVGMPEDVAGLICFLASKDADWITGNDFRIAGGMIT
ncbi:MAG: SDR family NAD(P)-dependent oxidoreductase [Candidatus Helarchaeota archaeon]